MVNKKDKHPNFSYGWQRAEILGAMFNGIFLMALCFSIFMEALQRFFNTNEVKNPRLIVVVGSMGLASNIAGLFLFHGHGHPHGGHAHAHAHDDHSDDEESHGSQVSGHGDEQIENERIQHIVAHPASARAFILNKAQSLGYDAAPPKHGEQQPLKSGTHTEPHYGAGGSSRSSSPELATSTLDVETSEAVRRHRQATGSSGHSHDNMNMTGVFLHVLGDAVGNVGVILTGLFIWFTDYWWRFYVDPAISLVIACIIFHSALPLVKSASFILLQGVPTSVSLEGVQHSVLQIEGVLGLHDLHIWQLNENKIVASMHILVNCSDEHSKRYMGIAAQVRRTLHLWGIHSSTIQPEFVPGGLKEAARLTGVDVQRKTDDQGRLLTPEGALVQSEVSRRDPACLLACDPECGDATCCELAPPATDGASSSAAKAT